MKLENSVQPNSGSAFLYAFDFDQTIVAVDSMEFLINAPGYYDSPEYLAANHSNWQVCMSSKLKQMAKLGRSISDLEERLSSIELFPGMAELLFRIQESRLTNPRSKFIILSDGNDFVIRNALAKLKPPVIPDAILSNKASIICPAKTDLNENNLIPYLKIDFYETQTHCPSCPTNLCKGTTLEKFIEENGPFEKVYYVGDGNNDICPGQRLREEDVLFVRKGFDLERAVLTGMNAKMNTPVEFPSKIVVYEHGSEIQQKMKF